MKTALVQFAPKLGDIAYNREKIYNYIKTVQSDLIIFPELSFSGYLFSEKDKLRTVSFSTDSVEFKQLSDLCFESGKIVITGFAEIDKDKIYNSAAIFLPEYHSYKIYRKTHLFYKEKYIFAQGDSGFFKVYSKQHDCNIGIMICYDWRFPESARTLALMGADLIVCPSNLVTNLWHKVMPARAIENKVYLAVANRNGTESDETDSLLFLGKSAVWDYSGDIICQASSEKEEVIYAEIHPKKTRIKSFNNENDIFKDRRPEFYSL